VCRCTLCACVLWVGVGESASMVWHKEVQKKERNKHSETLAPRSRFAGEDFQGVLNTPLLITMDCQNAFYFLCTSFLGWPTLS